MKKGFMAIGLVLWFAWAMPLPKVQAAEENPKVDIAEMLEGAKEQITEALEELDSQETEEIFDFIKEKISDGSLKTEAGLEDAIEEGEEKFNITVDEATAKQVVETMEKLEALGFSGEEIMDKAKALYEEHGAGFMEHSNEMIADAVEGAVSKAVGSFFENIWKDTKNFIRDLFSGF